ncbi:phage tail tape measure protein [Methylobrevis pamukkalensis]|uniref:Phage tail tape measure protein, lambda family n=1 Tax=Methylobrevis pamukkalensis TaxID=1439726 RepID=A0A1E3H9G8_9HYPH|nr:phage tail tape measure protein [Methylobrevis pamukkalensis]ODN72436.1 hypothetical protein A6302_00182 [Methylobrevis pamukkalensis]
MATTGDELAAFGEEADRIEARLIDLERVSNRFSASLSRGLAAAALEGRSLDDVLRQLALSLSASMLNGALQPIVSGISSLAGGLLGTSGGVVPFADGGVVASPSYFPMADGRTGLAGEAGAEAILPLARGTDGTLGVRASGGQVAVTFHVTTPDAASFRRSEAQITALLARAVERGRRGL